MKNKQKKRKTRERSMMKIHSILRIWKEIVKKQTRCRMQLGMLPKTHLVHPGGLEVGLKTPNTMRLAESPGNVYTY
ncbi:MAG TPA: hypothetical protein VJ385_16550 [Fibrobacteria bacterium]|nr:hypothetical protein [Fibrobacteria bacterium]